MRQHGGRERPSGGVGDIARQRGHDRWLAGERCDDSEHHTDCVYRPEISGMVADPEPEDGEQPLTDHAAQTARCDNRTHADDADHKQPGTEVDPLDEGGRGKHAHPGE